MKLLVVESPHKAKVIGGFLPKSEYIVAASVGHIRDIPMPKAMTEAQRQKYGSFGVDVNSPDFDALYKNSPDKAKVIQGLKQSLAKCSELILMTDDDFEGDAIAWHLLQVLSPKVPVYRATTHEITKDGVKEALQSKVPVREDKNTPASFFGRAQSALARGSWDRIYGFASSPYVWRAIKSGTSSGRVQTPGAKLVVEREIKRLRFTSISFYTIIADFDGVKATLAQYQGARIANSSHIDEDGKVKDGYLLITDSNVKEIIDFLGKQDYFVKDVGSKPYRRTPPPPFMTSSALQSIGAKTRMGSKQITGILQSLYMEGSITYIRTVSVTSAPEAVAAARKTLIKTFGKGYASPSPRQHKDKKSDNSGHECIRPTLSQGGELLSKKFNDVKTQAVFDAIRNRMMASQSIDCTGTTWIASYASRQGDCVFTASETEIDEPGWTKIYDTGELEKK